MVTTVDSAGAPFVDLANYYWGDEDPARLPRKGDPFCWWRHLVFSCAVQPCNFNSGALPGGGLDTIAGALNVFWSQVARAADLRWDGVRPPLVTSNHKRPKRHLWHLGIRPEVE